METISIVDTSICTDNLGDEIIMDSVNQVISDLFPDAYVYRVPSHEALSDRTMKFVRDSSWCFIGGTNLLSSHLSEHGLWRLSENGARALGSSRTVCLATGWNDYMSPASDQTRELLQIALSADITHSARDQYTRDHLKAVGLNATSTSCVTTWALTEDHCSNISSARADTAVFTLSAWRSDPEADRVFVDTLRSIYKRVYFFPQMQDDYQYFQKFGWEDVIVLPATVKAYNDFLRNEAADFIGTRLHGGIRALQMGHRALILSIDNRAAEIGKDIGLPVAPRNRADLISSWLESSPPVRINLPREEIAAWKDQFLPERRRSAPPVRHLPEVPPPSSRSGKLAKGLRKILKSAAQ